MPDHDWNKIRLEYITDGTTSYRKLADKYGVPLRTLAKRAKLEDWPAKRIQSADRVARESEEKAISDTVSVVDTIIQARNALARRAAEMVEEATRSSDIVNLTNALQILAKMAGLQPDLDEREQRARIASIEAKAQVQEEDTEAGVFMIPEKWEDADE